MHFATLKPRKQFLIACVLVLEIVAGLILLGPRFINVHVDFDWVEYEQATIERKLQMENERERLYQAALENMHNNDIEINVVGIFLMSAGAVLIVIWVWQILAKKPPR